MSKVSFQKKFIFISSSLLFAKIFSLLFLILQIHSFGNSNKIRENRGCCWLENTIFFQKRGQEGDNQNLLFGDFLDGAHHHQQIWLLISRQANIERRKCYPHNFFSKLCCWGSKNVLFDWFFFRIWFFCRPLFWSILRSYFAMNSYARLYIASYMHNISYYLCTFTYLKKIKGKTKALKIRTMFSFVNFRQNIILNSKHLHLQRRVPYCIWILNLCWGKNKH